MYTPLDSEQQLLSALAEGNRAATEQVYRKHFPPIRHWIETHGGQDSDAPDVFQEAMVVLYEKAQNAEFRLTCKIGTYLFAVARHLWLKRLQQKQRQPGSLISTAGEDGGRDWAYEDDLNVHHERELHYEQLDAALDRLGEPCRSLLKAFYHEGQSMQEIAAGFGYTNPDNAKTQKYKCLTRLKKLFFSVQAK